MRQRLHLTVTGNFLRLVATQPRRPWADMLHVMRGSTRTGPEASRQVLYSDAPFTPELLIDGLGQLIESAFTASELHGAELAVELGLAYARLGVLRLSGTAAAGGLEAYASAWAEQTWHIDAVSQVVRAERLPRQDALLVSCVDRAVFDVLAQFARDRELRFVSCQPAALAQLDQLPSASAGDSVLAWTEPAVVAARAPVVQLVHCRSGHMQAIWRGWLSPPTKDDTEDAALDGALRRFIAAQHLSASTPVHIAGWDRGPAMTNEGVIA